MDSDPPLHADRTASHLIGLVVTTLLVLAWGGFGVASLASSSFAGAPERPIVLYPPPALSYCSASTGCAP